MNVKLESNLPLLERKVHTREKILAILNDRVDINDLREKMNVSSIGASAKEVGVHVHDDTVSSSHTRCTQEILIV